MIVSDLVDEVLDAISPKSRPTYRPGIVRLRDGVGSAEICEVRLPQLEAMRDAARRECGDTKVASARERGRELMSYDPDAYGRGAGENFVRAARFFFNYAVESGYADRNPALRLKAPRRRRSVRRPLTEVEMADLWRGALAGSNDPELDSRLLKFLRFTAARREGCLNLAIDHLDMPSGAVTLSEKNGDTRRLPLARPFIDDLLGFAAGRGARAPGDAVFRYRNAQPLTRRRFNTIFDRVDANCTWTQALDVGAHWIRHTTLADINAVAGLRVAEAYAGHSDDKSPIHVYTKVPFEDLAAAHDLVFGPRE